MIIVFYGQPSSGKTTLAKLLQERIFLQNQQTPVIIDENEIEKIFKHKNNSKENRLNNLKRISDIATFLESKYKLVIISAIYPMQDVRFYLDSICINVVWVYLFYDGIREKKDLDIKDFQIPYLKDENNFSINTSDFSPKLCIDKLLQHISL